MFARCTQPRVQADSVLPMIRGTTSRRLRPRATLKHALDFRRHYYGTQRRPPATPVPLTWASVPEDYDVQLKALRRHLDISPGWIRALGRRCR